MNRVPPRLGNLPGGPGMSAQQEERPEPRRDISLHKIDEGVQWSGRAPRHCRCDDDEHACRQLGAQQHLPDQAAGQSERNGCRETRQKDERHDGAEALSGNKDEGKPRVRGIGQRPEAQRLLQVSGADPDAPAEILSRIRGLQFRGDDLAIVDRFPTRCDHAHGQHEVVVDRIRLQRRPKRPAKHVKGSMGAHGRCDQRLIGLDPDLVVPVGAFTRRSILGHGICPADHPDMRVDEMAHGSPDRIRAQEGRRVAQRDQIGLHFGYEAVEDADLSDVGFDCHCPGVG